MTAPEPLSSSEARRIATTLLAQLVNVRSDPLMYVGLATAALAYATLAPQLGPSQAEAINRERSDLGASALTAEDAEALFSHRRYRS